MIAYKELLTTPEYWTTRIQLGLYNMLENYMESNNLSRVDLANRLGVTKGYVSQVLNGDFDHRLSKLVELSMAIGMVPQISYVPMDKVFAPETQAELTFDIINNNKTPISKLLKSFNNASLQFSKAENKSIYKKDLVLSEVA